MNANNENNRSWKGASLKDLYVEESPWNYSTPPLIPSKYHHVLYELPVNLNHPPGPHYNANPKHWDETHVRMPYSPESLFVFSENGEEVVKPRWSVICDSLSKPINSVSDLEKAVNSYNLNLQKFTILQHLIEAEYSETEKQEFFNEILPGIIKLCLSLPEIVPGTFPLLLKNHCKSVSLSQLQIASLLANGFLCTFITRKESNVYLPGANFFRLFSADQRPKRKHCVIEKIKCILHYFKRVIAKNPVGVVTFERKFIQKREMPRWDAVETNLGNTKVHINSAGTIEKAKGFLQVDFANKRIGGGVLSYGCVQEEIRFVLNPELIVGRLFVEELSDCEAIVIYGSEQYSNYSGYSDDFKFNGNVNDATPYDDFGRRKTTISVIDATRFNKAKDQYHCSTILRELNKAYVGFSSYEKSNLPPVATGNWGCGAFKGDPYLKSLLQLMACSATKRNFVYYSFGDDDLRDAFYNMYTFLANNRVTVCQLWRHLCRFCVSDTPQTKLYSFLQQCHFDMKSQPTLKQFISSQKRKNDISPTKPPTASTSAVKTVDESEKVAESSIKKSPAKVKTESVNRIETNVKIESKQQSIKKHKAEEERMSRKKVFDSNELINLIGLMDGNCNNNGEDTSEATCGDSLLSKIDKMKTNVNNIPRKSEETTIPMEIDSVEEPKPITNFIEDKKKKITDYFSKLL